MGVKQWNNYLNSFMWIPDVRAVGTNQARLFLRKKNPRLDGRF